MERSNSKEILEKLYPLEEKGQAWERFCKERRRFLIIGALLAAVVLVLFGIAGMAGSNQVEPGGYIRREDYAGSDKEIDLQARVEQEEEPFSIKLLIKPRRYDQETVLSLQKEAAAVLEEKFLGSNESADHVSLPLYLPSALEGYPFTLEWESSDELLLSSQGIPGENLPAAGGTVTLKATYRYQDFSCVQEWPLRVFPPEQTEEEKLSIQLEEAATEAEREDPEAELVLLPQEVQGQKVQWKQNSGSGWIGLAVLWLAICAALYISRGDNLRKEEKKREGELTEAYPEIVSKIGLLLEAGQTLRQIMARLCQEYEKKVEEAGKRNYAYEEIRVLVRQMGQGVPEREAYRQWGNRTGLASYRRLAALLVQSLRRGTAALQEQLADEARNAWEDKKANAKQKGEEIGTKLLLPMMIMLILVMALLMIPAFFTFVSA